MSIQTTNSGRVLADGVFDFLSQIEQGANTFNGLIHDDSLGVPTLGYGYAMLVRNAAGAWSRKADLLPDLASVGIVLTQSQLNVLQQILTFLNQQNQAGASQLIPQLAAGVQPITQPQGRQLFDVEVARHAVVLETQFQVHLGAADGHALYTSFANSRELEALVSLAYNGALTIGFNLATALNGPLVNGVHVGNRAEAWYEIRYQTNNPPVAGIAKRRFVEAQILGLYHDENAPTAQEARDAMRMLTLHRNIIMAYEGRFGIRPDGVRPAGGRDMIDTDPSAANATFGGTALYEVDTLTEALTPARNAFITWLNSSGRLEGQPNLVATDWHSTAIYYNPDSPSLDATGDDAAPLTVVPGLRNNLMVGRPDALNTITGGAGDDYLIGGSIADTLDGGAGADVLIGGAGVDTLRGGAGVDKYVYRTGDGIDTIGGNDNDGAINFDGVVVIGEGATLLEGAGIPTWRNEILGEEFFFRLVNNELLIARSVDSLTAGNAFPGGEAVDRLVVEDYRYGDLGISLPLGLASSSSTIQEMGSVELFAALPGSAESGSFIRLSSDALSSNLRIVNGADTFSFTDGHVDIPLVVGQQFLQLGLLAIGDVDTGVLADELDYGQPRLAQPLNLTAQIISQNGAITSAGSLDLTFRASDEQIRDNSGFQIQLRGSSTDAWLVDAIDFIPPDGLPIQPSFVATGANELIFGSSVPYFGPYSNDYIDGGAGDDFILGGFGADTLLGGDGNDFIRGSLVGNYSYEFNAELGLQLPHLIDGAGWGILDAGNGNFIPLNWEYGGLGPLAGFDQSSYIDGGAGNDDIEAGTNSDVVHGGTGNDRISGNEMGDTLLGEDGDDIIFGDGFDNGPNAIESTILSLHGADFIDGGAGNDFLYGQGGADTIYGGIGNDQIVGDDANTGAFDDYLDGEDGDDEIYGAEGNDTLIGGIGNDTLFGDALGTAVLSQGDDYLDGGAGDDILSGDGGADILIGGDGNDFLQGENPDTDASAQGDDYLDGGAGADILLGYGGADTLLGGDGNDDLHGEGSGVAISLHGNDILDGGAGNDTLAGDGGDDNLSGGDGDDLLFGDSSQIPIGNHGNDILDGGAGADQLQGGGGNDTLLGGDGADILFGDDGDDILDGGAGSDRLDAGAGNDVLISDGDNETLQGGAGDDTFIINGGGGHFEIIDNEGANTVIINGVDASEMTSHVGPDGYVYLGSNTQDFLRLDAASFQSVSNVTFGSGDSWNAEFFQHSTTPGAGGGSLILSAGVSLSDISYAAKGDDLILLYSGAVSDWINTSSLFSDGVMWNKVSSDSLGLTPGSQAFVLTNWYLAAPGSYVFQVDDENSQSQVFTSTAANLKHIAYGTSQEDQIVGGVYADDMRGYAGDDFISGGNGDDLIDPGAGADFASGDAGNDTYVIRPGGGSDVIVDSGGSDSIHFEDGLRSTDVTFHDVAGGLEIVIGNPADNNRTVLADWSTPSNRIEQFVFAGDGVTWSAAEVAARIVGDRRPAITVPLGDKSFDPGAAFSFAIPPSTFVDPDAGDSITLSAIGADYSELPAWLTFNPLTLTFSGTLPAGSSETAIGVWATDMSGLSSVSTFVLAGVVPINGTNQGETLTGTEGRDRIFGSGGGDFIYALGGNDIVNGGDGVDSLTGGAGNDTLNGDADTDFLYGGEGDDILNGGAGDDNYDGGAGSDTFLFERPAPWAMEFNNVILGTDPSETNTIFFGSQIQAANVRVTYETGQVILHVASASDPLNESMSVSVETGGSKLATLQVRFADQPGVVWTESDLRALFFIGSARDDELDGLASADLMRGNAGNDFLYGADGNDDLRGGSGIDHLSGQAGDDTYRFGRGDLVDDIDDSEGQNRIVLDAGISTAQVTLYRTSGVGINGASQASGDDLVIAIDNGQDQLRLDSFFDPARQSAFTGIEFASGTVWNLSTILANVVNVAGAANSQTGTAGNDTFLVDNWQDSVSGLGGTDTINSSVTFTLGSDVENLTLTGLLDNSAYGNSLSNVLTGNAGANILDGNAGADTLIGGAGDDTYYVSGIFSVEDAVTELVGGGYDTMIAQTHSAILPDNVERMVVPAGIPFFALGEMRYTGNALDNVIDATGTGSNAANPLVLDGGAGADLLIATTGEVPIRFVVDNVGDVVVQKPGGYLTSGPSGTIESSVSYALPDAILTLELTGSSATTGTGNANSNRLDGSTGVGINTLIGLAGDDEYVLGTGDMVLEAAGAGNDTVTLASAAGFAGGAAALSSFANIENLGVADSFGAATLTGDSGANKLTGNASANRLVGAGGDDVLEGKAGADVYAGFGANTGNDIVRIANLQGPDLNTVEYSQSENIAANQIQYSRQGNDLVLQAAVGSTIRVESFFANAQAPNMRFSMFSGGTRFDYTAAQVIAAANGTNGGPSVANLISDAATPVNQAFSYQVASNAFSDIESQSSLAYSATQTNGSALPSWLTFNPTTRTFSGTPITAPAQVTVRVTATDAGSLSVFDDFAINVLAPPIVGTSGNDNLVGTAFSDIIQGLAGNDTLDGAGGADQLFGGLGDDTYVVDDPGDVVTELTGEGIDLVQSSIAYTLGTNLENLALTGAAAINGTGNALNNLLTGNSGNNILIGGDGNDTLNGGSAGTDTLQGGLGDDTYIVDRLSGINISEALNEGIDLVLSSVTHTLGANFENLTFTGSGTAGGGGNALDNIINGSDGNNVISGGDGNDTLYAGALGTDTLRGGLGNDIYIVDRTANVTLQEFASEGTDLVRSSVNFTLGGEIENLTLTGAGTITGTGNGVANVITGNTAANTLDGKGGIDTMIGGAGDDTYVVDVTGDIVTEAGSEGTDLVQSSATYTLSANVENLTLTSTGVVDGTGNTLDNVINGNSAINTLTGGAGNDTLDGKGGVDTMIGGIGNDAYFVDVTNDVITELLNEGTDTVTAGVTGYTLAANVENLILSGTIAAGTGNGLDNILTGNSSGNTLTGGAGNDTLDPGSSGTDALLGGTGDDTYLINRASGITITENLNEGTDTVSTTVSLGATALAANVENLVLLGSVAVGTGNTLNNVITGNVAANSIDGGTGADQMNGGAGDDTYAVDNAGDTIGENTSEGTDTVNSSVSFSLSANVENLTLTGSGTLLTATGNGLDNIITGNSVANTLVGGDGNDTLNGAAGGDTMQGGLGNDLYSVDNTGDVVTEAVSAGTDTIQTSVQLSGNLANNVENLLLLGSIVTGTGNSLDNAITGNSAANTLSGSDGNDTLDGMGGTDNMSGGLGDDTFVVDVAADIVTEAAGQGTDTIRTSVTLSTWAANVENMTLIGTNSINTPTGASASSLNNVIIGNGFANTIDGGAGDDTLNGMGGSDAITGGLGADTYQYTSGGGVDTINNVAADSLTDRLVFTDLASTQITFTRGGAGNADLIATVAGGGSVTVTAWFTATANRLDFVNFTNRQVTAAEIDTLVSGGGGSFPLSVIGLPSSTELFGTQTTRPGIKGNFSSYRVPDEMDINSAFENGKEPLAEENEPQSKFANFGDYFGAASTLGAKLAANDQPPVRWMPIKSFLHDDAAVGVSRLIDAMSSFGTEVVTDANAPSHGAMEGGALEQLTAQHELGRFAQLNRGEFRALLD